MKARNLLALVAGVVLIVLGVLFLLFIQPDVAGIVSDAIFVGAGFLLIRKAYRAPQTVSETLPPTKALDGGKNQLAKQKNKARRNQTKRN